MKKSIYILVLFLFSCCVYSQTFLDFDCDGYGSNTIYNPATHSGQCSAQTPGDCNDNDANDYPKNYYYDADGDGYGGTGITNPICNPGPGYVLNSSDCNDYDPNLFDGTVWLKDVNGDMLYTPPIDQFGATGCVRCENCYLPSEFGISIADIQNYHDPNFNWTQTDNYDILGNLTGATRTYFDDLGKATETLSKDFVTNKIWGAETLYDNFGREEKTSFLAPSPKQSLLRVSYLSPASTYSFATTNLADYYSNSNAQEPYQATASQPYSQINYDKLNPGNVINVVGGNQVGGEWKTGYSFTVPAAQEMYYVYGYNYYEGPIVVDKEEIITKFYKTVSIDANGEENVAFTDGEGKVLAVARSGGTSTYPVHSLIGTQGYVDVHIPKGITTAQITLIGGSSLYDVYDLKTGLLVVTALTGGNAYRIQAKITPLTDPKIYVTNVTSGVLSYDVDAKGISYRVNYYDYSVNIYNKTGLLVKNVQPKGYQSNTAIKATPSHMVATATSFISTYKYNTLGQLIESKSPDEGISKFIYRKDGQIRYSQSALQSNTKVSYTDYDTFGRPIESGVIANTLANATAAPDGALISGTRSEQVFSIYDYAENFTMVPLVSIPTGQTLATLLGTNIQYYKQNNLSGNVAMTFKKNGSTIPAITWYSYDIYGRVEWVVQYNKDIGAKTIDYEYDYKGNVKKVLYQKYQSQELFAHRYTYDLNDVLKKAETSTDNSTFTTHADYSYYLTGELKRVNIAQGTQGMDYVYTLGGILKSINHPSLEQAKDPGGDTNDLFGLTLDYYAGDYTRTGTNIATSPTVSGYNKDQYNGNIKAARWANKHANMDLVGGNIEQKAYLYNYNRNNWLTDATFGNTSNAATITPSTKYTEGGLSYDANGNINSLTRTNHEAKLVDRLSYNYSSNKLNYIREDAAVTPDVTDIENQSSNNYKYDVIGQLIENDLEDLAYNYNTQGLVTGVINTLNGKPLVTFDYNERGQRIQKGSFSSATGELLSTDYYILDVSGNVMSVYNKPNNSNPLAQKELPIYGSGRLGVFFKAGAVSNYEITDHLGNVRAVVQKVSDIPYVSMLSYNDYYPFGEKLPFRNSSSNYRYAFQGQELDGEIGMEAFQLRLWDGRIGRWLSPDPYGQYSSPYLGMGNNPISRIDPDGGWETWFGAFWHNLWDGRDGEVFQSEDMGDWGIQYEGTYNSEGPIAYTPNFGGTRYNNFGYTDITALKFTTFSNSIPCIKCHHEQTIDNGSKIDMSWFADRQSGYLFDDGQMRSGFVGDSKGANGVIYGTTQNAWAPGPDLYTIRNRFMKILRSDADFFSTQADILGVDFDDKSVDIKTFKYMDSIHVRIKHPMNSSMVIGIRAVEREGIIVNGKDTLKF